MHALFSPMTFQFFAAQQESLEKDGKHLKDPKIASNSGGLQ